ncbi:Nif3-like dinuclear metal center hexameric protein [Caloramator sp. CAR-1]|uniref:Nif3-like dinuclear metal center hexameric protein n=1 Tax=Caloramator sp. CAR-1 TaxID=3062777 RepID=UPI0026E3D8F0|nr:Nif3-like dinuclear metal center hexameric protein [Caloramator sp. CAR-1]MDO6354455.1 Nif3-like dinuclear metal center hexameric protein [Caloramator sp. CAR-1]
MDVSAKNIIDYLEKMFPPSLAEDYDNVGLLIGDKDKNINKILFTLDVTRDTLDEAIKLGCDMIISHHPLIFTPLKKIKTDEYIGSIIIKAIKNDINIYAVHTNFDNAEKGLNDFLAKLLELEDIEILSPHKEIKLFKIVVFVPKFHADVVRNAILTEGAGHIGNYSYCSFNVEGQGTFMPLEGSNPFIGEKNKIEYVEEVRIETIVKEKDLNRVISSMIKAHPYEEVAYDVYPLQNSLKQGTGRVGNLKGEIRLKEFINLIKQKFNVDNVRIVGNLDKKIKRIGIVGGSGSSFIRDALNKGCDVLVTGDIKHHDAIIASELGLNIIDVGHFASEYLAVPYLLDIIKKSFDVECILTETNKNPFAVL